MRRLGLFGVAALAVFALVAVMASGASALEWLENGAAIGAAKAATTEGTLTLIDMATGTEIECDGYFIGKVGPGNKDTIEEAEDLEGHKKDIKCTRVAGPCEEAKVLVEPIHLPWTTELVAGVDTLGNAIAVDLIKNSGAGEPGYLVECKVIFKIDVTCTGETSSFMENGVGDVLGTFTSEAEENGTMWPESKPGECSDGSAGNENGLLLGEGLTFLTGGGALQVS